MESGKASFTQQTMEYMTHLVEECNNIVVAHQRRFVRGGFGQISNHGCQWVATRSVRQGVSVI